MPVRTGFSVRRARCQWCLYHRREEAHVTVVEGSIDIKAPIRQVFEAVTDPRRAPDWNSHFIHAQDVTWPLRVGATWHQTAMVAGRSLNVTCRVTGYQPP